MDYHNSQTPNHERSSRLCPQRRKEGEKLMRDYTRIYINGAWITPAAGTVIDVVNPATERPAGQITLCTPSEVDAAVSAARKAFISFSRTKRQERLDL